MFHKPDQIYNSLELLKSFRYKKIPTTRKKTCIVEIKIQTSVKIKVYLTSLFVQKLQVSSKYNKKYI